MLELLNAVMIGKGLYKGTFAKVVMVQPNKYHLRILESQGYGKNFSVTDEDISNMEIIPVKPGDKFDVGFQVMTVVEIIPLAGQLFYKLYKADPGADEEGENLEIVAEDFATMELKFVQ